jgi:hypothetical protein
VCNYFESPTDDEREDALWDEIVDNGIVDLPDDGDVRNAPTRLQELEGMGYTRPEDIDQIDNGPATIAGLVTVEDFSQISFQEVYDNIYWASLVNEFTPADDGQVWEEISSGVLEAISHFEGKLGQLERDGGWEGATQKEAVENIRKSLAEPTAAGTGAAAMSILVPAFENTILDTRENIVSNKPSYDQALEDGPNYDDQIKDAYNRFAQTVMEQVYVPNITLIAENNPAFTAGAALEVDPLADPGLVDPNSTGAEGAEEFDGPGPLDGPKPFTAAEIPNFGGTTVPDLTDTMPAVPTFPTANPPGLNSPTDAMRAATEAAGNALGSAPDAAKQAADSAQKPSLAGPGDPPEGVLGLGPKGLGDSPRGGGVGGKTGAGAGTRLPRSLADGRPTGAAVTSSTRLPSTAGATGAGPGMMGPPGAGAPTGAQRGGDNNNGHQVLKALRRKKNGQEVAGEADAVVAVLGAPEKQVKPKADQTDQTDPPGTDVRPVHRSAHRPEQATQVLNP